MGGAAMASARVARAQESGAPVVGLLAPASATQVE